MTRTSMKSCDVKNLQNVQKSINESFDNKIKYRNKLQTETIGFINTNFNNKSVFDSPTKKKVQIKKIIEMTSKHKRLFRMVRQDGTL